MEQTWKSSMRASISDVLGTMFYSPVEFDDETPQENIAGHFFSEDYIFCKIVVSQDLSLSVFAAISKESLKEISADFTGNYDVSDQDCSETFKEMLNMICGGALANSYGDSDFKLGIPKIVSLSSLKKEIDTQKDGKTFLKGDLLNGEIMVVTF